MEDDLFKFTQTRESLDFALESGKMATWDINLDTNQISCSKEMLDLWGIDIRDFENNRSILQRKVHPDDLDQMNIEINHAIINRSIYDLEYRIIPYKDEIRWVHSRGRCTFSADSDRPVRFAGIVYDITEKKTKETELAKALKARSDFLSIAGHELKTPLTCLQLQLKVMEEQIKEISLHEVSAEILTHGIEKQQQHLLRISRIIDNLLDETKISEGLFSLHPEDYDLVEIASSAIEQVNLIASGEKIKIGLTKTSTIRGYWDRFRLEQVLLNLLINAIRYGNKKPIHVEVMTEERNALIIVRDQGIGISPENFLRVFQRFEQVNLASQSRGMGLGLYISNYIVQAHGGKIQLKSELEKGSEFIVSLPLKVER